jgi:hypothetical protein
MNTNLTTTRSIRSASFAACLALLFAGAVACGTEDGPTSAKTGSRPHTLSSIELIEGAKTSQAAYLQQLSAQAETAQRLSAVRADAARWLRGYPHQSKQPGFGDDRREQVTQPRQSDGPTTHHSPGFDKALPSEW